MLTRRHWLAGFGAALAGAVHAAPLSADGYTFQFEWLEGASGSAGADAHLDLGSLAANPAAIRSGRMLVTRRVAVRIDGPGSAAQLSVALGAEAPGCTVRVDGLVLSTIPRTITSAHRLGAAVVHQIELIIPRAAPAGSFLTNLQWLAQAS